MSYLDDMAEGQPLNIGALAKKTEKDPKIPQAAKDAAAELGFGRTVGGEEPRPGSEGKHSDKPDQAGEGAKPPVVVSRRKRQSGRPTGKLTLTGDQATLEAFLDRAYFERADSYVAMLGQLLRLWDETHGEVPHEFRTSTL